MCCAVRGIDDFGSGFDTRLVNCTNAISAGTVSQLTCQVKPTDKMKYIEAQLGCAAGMLITCIVFLVLFILGCFGICFDS